LRSNMTTPIAPAINRNPTASTRPTTEVMTIASQRSHGRYTAGTSPCAVGSSAVGSTAANATGADGWIRLQNLQWHLLSTLQHTNARAYVCRRVAEPLSNACGPQPQNATQRTYHQRFCIWRLEWCPIPTAHLQPGSFFGPILRRRSTRSRMGVERECQRGVLAQFCVPRPQRLVNLPATPIQY
jgi:hypothetical protein